MKKKIKQILICIVSLTLFCANVINSLAANEIDIKQGDTIKVPIDIISNPGICSARIKINYDHNAFEMLSQENGDIFPLSSFVAGNVGSKDNYAVWVGLNDVDKTGTLLYAEFKVSDFAKDGEYAISVTYDENDVFNLDEKNIKIDLTQPIIVIGSDSNTNNVTETGNSVSKSHSSGSGSTHTTNKKNEAVIVVENNKSGTFENFIKKRDYNDIFDDVERSAWYYNDVKSGYEYNLINGRSATEFVPSGNITVAEAITLASTLRTLYYNEPSVEMEAEGTWYLPFIDYAVENNIIDSKFFDNYDRPILRKEMAYIFSNALPSECYENINVLKEIPDMTLNDPFYSYVSKLYISGILTGDDEKGTFGGDREISRCETAAITDRLAIPTLRIAR